MLKPNYCMMDGVRMTYAVWLADSSHEPCRAHLAANCGGSAAPPPLIYRPVPPLGADLLGYCDTWDRVLIVPADPGGKYFDDNRETLEFSVREMIIEQ